MSNHLSRATLTPELVADLLDYRPNQSLLHFLGWHPFRSFAESLTKTIAQMVRFSFQLFILLVDFELFYQGLPGKY